MRGLLFLSSRGCIKLLKKECIDPECDGKLYRLKQDYYLIPIKEGVTSLSLHAKGVKVFQCMKCDLLHFVSLKSQRLKWREPVE